MPQICSRKLGSHYGQRKPWWHIRTVFQRMDTFGKELPAFNLKGETHINTSYGGVMSLLNFVMIIAYATITFNRLINKQNPDMSTVRTVNFFTGYDKVNLNELNYRLAFIVESFDDKKVRIDPWYVKYIARIWQEQDGQQFFTNLPLHECTDYDYS